MFDDIPVKPLAGYIFNHLSQKAVIHVAVLKVNTGDFLPGRPAVRVIAGMAFGEKSGERIAVRDIIGAGDVAVTDGGGMSHDHFDGKGNVGVVWVPKSKANVLGNVSVGINQSPLDKLPNANGGGQLGNGGDPVFGIAVG